MGGGMGGAGMMAHGRAIAGAHALHAVGHIGAGQRDQYLKSSRNAIAGMRKPKAPATFGSLAPSGLSFGSEDDFGGDTSGF
jgi:hypothetical protein